MGIGKRPKPIGDLDWPHYRARAFAERTLTVWSEYLKTMPKLTVAHAQTPSEARDALARPVPDDPLPDDEL